MGFSTRFSETRLEQDGNLLRLLGKADEVLLELRGFEIDDAVRSGFVDRNDYHFSMFEYARMRAIMPAVPPAASSSGPRRPTNVANFDRSFLAGLNISWEG